MLTVLGEQYRRWDWLDHAMDTYLTLIDEHQKAGDSVATASTLTELGGTMPAEPGDVAR